MPVVVMLAYLTFIYYFFVSALGVTVKDEAPLNNLFACVPQAPGVIRLDPPGADILDVAAGQFDDMATEVTKLDNVFDPGVRYDEVVPLCDVISWGQDIRLDRCRCVVV